MKKNYPPDRARYFEALRVRLAKEDPEFLREITEFQLDFWGGSAYTRQRAYGERLKTQLNITFDYAPSTLVANLRRAIFDRRRAERWATTVTMEKRK